MAVGRLPARTLLTVGLTLVSAGISGWLAARLYRQQRDAQTSAYRDLARPYFWSCVAFALGILGVGVAQVAIGEESLLLFALLFVIFPPWTVFGFNFVGRGQFLTRRRIAACVLFSSMFVLYALGDAAKLLPQSPDSATVLSLTFSTLSLVLLAVVFTLSGLVLLSAYRHRGLSLTHGVVAILPIVWLILGAQVTRSSTPVWNDLVLSTISLGIAGTVVVATTRYDVVTRRPGTGIAGERTAVREMDEATVTVEPDGNLVNANRAAWDLFGDRLGDGTLSDVLRDDAPVLADRETVECWTTDGRKKFDPRVTELTTAYDEVFGYTVILIDITDREIRRQRIEVLNRILRHNIRNSLDVIKADAEVLDDEERAASILDTTDRLKRLSGDARRIETLLRRSQEEWTTTELTAVVDSVVERVVDEYPEASFSVDLSDLSVRVDAELCRFALHNVLENAVVHNDSDHPRVEVKGMNIEAGARVVVEDDGPGIPASERAVIERQAESPQEHASSLGLWSTNWAVQQLGGDLSFRESDLGGTAVVVELPTRV